MQNLLHDLLLNLSLDPKQIHEVVIRHSFFQNLAKIASKLAAKLNHEQFHMKPAASCPSRF